MLKGILCADPKHKGEKYSFEECLGCARNRSPRRCEFPYQLIKAASKNAESRADAGTSATMLLDCPRRIALAQTEDYYEEVDKLWPRERGTAFHTYVEQNSEDLGEYHAEIRLRKSVLIDGVAWEVTGKSDLVWLDHDLIVDFKSTGSLKKRALADAFKKGRAKPEHEDQINIYAWLWWGGYRLDTGEQVHVPIKEGEIQYCDATDMRKISGIEIWPHEVADQFVIERLAPLVRHKTTDQLPDIMTDFWGKRHIFCRHEYCPLREACDRRAIENGEHIPES